MSDTQEWVRAMFEARSVAVVGASDNPVKLSGRPIAYLKRFGYPGEVYPVNASRETVQGMRAYPDLASTGVVPDLVMIMVDAASSIGVIRECGRIGVPVAIVSAAGFAETGPAGAQLQDALRQAIAESGVRVLGPNCLGLIGASSRLTATFTSALDEGDLVRPGGTALISQSGAFGTFIFSAASLAGVDFSHYANTGNEVDLDVVEILSALCDQPEVTTLAAYFEGLSGGDRLAQLGRKALQADKPLIVSKAGSSPAGARAVSSHTASIVGSDTVFRDVCRQYGIVAVESINDIVDMMVIFDRARRLRGRRLSILTLSGGAAALMTDVAAANGIDVPVWEPEWQERVARTIPSFGSPTNPIDLTAELIKDPEILRGALDVALDHPGTDVVAVLIGNASHGAERLVEIIADADRRSSKPVVVVWTGNNRGPLDALAAQGVARFDDPARAARALGAVASFGEHRARALDGEDAEPPTAHRGAATLAVADRRRRGETRLDELAAGELLSGRGVPVVASHVVQNADQAWKTAHDVGLPCVMKILSSQVAHKSDVGGVLLGLGDKKAVQDAYERLARLGSDLGLPDAGVLIQPMVRSGPDDIELIVGAHRDVSFGHVVTVGFGGVLVDVLGDNVTLLPPFGPAEASRALSRLRGARVLGEFRGRPARDVGALVDLLVGFSAAVAELSDEVEEMELNPVLLREAGAGAVALDALVTLADLPD